MRIPLPAGFLTTPLAHRGYHNRADRRPENSPAAFRAAIAAGYGIELDVQMSRDGQAMVFHDETLDRLTDATGWVKDRTAAALSQIKLRDGDDGIATLPEILALIAGRAPVLIEVKDQTHAMTRTDGRLEAATAQALANYPGPVAVMSFNPDSIARMARLAPRIARGLTTSAYGDDWQPLDLATRDRLRGIPDYDATHSTFISHEAADLARPSVSALKAGGAAILCWTIRSPIAEAAARAIADNITFEGYGAALVA